MIKLLSTRIPELLKNEGAREPVTVDGYKYFLGDGSWLMIRVSGTEAVTRVYVESSSNQRLSEPVFFHPVLNSDGSDYERT